MTSGTITAYAPGVDRTLWARFSGLVVALTASLYALGIAFLLVADPFDRGTPDILGRRGVPDQLPHSGNASRARDPRFDAAIFGNSHVQALRPARLDALTGLAFVSLMMPGTFAADQLDTLEWYLAVQPRPRAIVIGTDVYWCRDWSARNEIFPRWLYAPSFPTYLAGLASYRNLREAGKRIAFLRSGKGAEKPDGYWDYSQFYDGLNSEGRDRSHPFRTERRPFPVNAPGAYPDLERLATLLPRIPRETALVLLRPPTYRTAFPPPGTDEARSFDACLARIETVAARRPRTAVLDLMKPGGANDDPANFYDWVHYRDRMAVQVEAALSQTLRTLRD